MLRSGQIALLHTHWKMHVPLKLHASWHFICNLWTHKVHVKLQHQALRSSKAPSLIPSRNTWQRHYLWKVTKPLPNFHLVCWFWLGHVQRVQVHFWLPHIMCQWATNMELETASCSCAVIIWSRVYHLFALCMPSSMATLSLPWARLSTNKPHPTLLWQPRHSHLHP